MHAQTLRDLILEDEVLVAPGVFNTLTAKVVESIGYDAVYLGGGYTAGASMGKPEPVVTRTEMCDTARGIAHEVDLPLIADGNAGFGNPAHTYRTVKEFAKNGVDAIHVEDQVYPKRMHYHEGIMHTVPIEEMEKKVRAARRANDEIDEDILLIARTDAGRGDETDSTIRDAVERVNAYLDAGADVGMLFPTDWEELEYAGAHVDGPLVFVMAEHREPRPSTAELEELGYDLAIYPLTSTIATVNAVQGVYQTLYEDGTIELDDEACETAVETIESLVGLPELYDIEEESGNK